MRIVVVGATGNLGSATVRALSADGRHDVTGVARRVPTPDGGAVSWHTVDVARDDLVPVLVGADAVVHLAWKFQPTHRPEVTWETNVVGTRRVLDAVASAGVPTVVVASSIAAYSPVGHDHPVTEDWHTDGASSAAYCREKAYVERVLDAFESVYPDVRLVRARPAFVFQRSAASEQRRIFGGAAVRPALLDRRRIPLVPVPAGLRLQAVHAGDIGQAITEMVERPVAGPFNLAADRVLRARELGNLMGARTASVPPRLARNALHGAWHARALPVPGTLLDAVLRVPVMDSARARDELHWQPRHTAAEALEAFLLGAPEQAGSDLPPLRP